jgi:hypothetical protein
VALGEFFRGQPSYELEGHRTRGGLLAFQGSTHGSQPSADARLGVTLASMLRSAVAEFSG